MTENNILLGFTRADGTVVSFTETPAREMEMTVVTSEGRSLTWQVDRDAAINRKETAEAELYIHAMINEMLEELRKGD